MLFLKEVERVLRKVRLMSLALAAVLLCTLLPPSAQAAPTLYFTAVNDRMCELSDDTMPFWQNGVLYVAGATVNGPDDLGIRYSYNAEKSVALLYKGQRLLYCNLAEGTMENNRTGERYAGSPIVRSGMVFFPISALVSLFDLKYSTTKIAYGYLLRIRDDNAVLSDEAFIDAANDPIQKRYQQYERAHSAESGGGQDGSSTPSQPSVYRDRTVYLLLPVSEEGTLMQLLSVLDTYDVHATFLLTPELAERAGDGIRRIAATGNAAALQLSAETAEEALAQIERGNDALWRAANLRTRLVYSGRADRPLREALTAAGYCPLTVNVSDFTSSGSHWAQTALDYANRYGSARLYLDAGTSAALYLGTTLSRLGTERCAVAALSEVTA